MKTSYIVGGIVILLLIILFSVKQVVSNKNTLTEMLNAKDLYTIRKAELPEKKGTSQNFSYSIWLYVNNWNYNNGSYKPIFGKFNDSSNNPISDYDSHIEDLNTCSSISTYTADPCDKLKPLPVVTFDKIRNDILVYLPYLNETVAGAGPVAGIHQCTVTNIPIQKWVNLSITLYKKTLDIYINGKLNKTCVLPNIPNMEEVGTGDLLITPGNGFDGYTSKFQAFNEALNPQEIWNIYSNGYGSVSSTLGDYQVKMSLIENGSETNSLTL